MDCPTPSSASTQTAALVNVVTDDRLGLLLADWLDASDWARLDSAMTSRAHRSAFLQLLSRAPVRQPPILWYELSHRDSLPLLNWLATRNVGKLAGQWRLSLASFEMIFYAPDTERLLKLFRKLAIVHLGNSVAGLDVNKVIHCDQLEDLYLENVMPLHAPSSSPSAAAIIASAPYFPRLARCSLQHCPFNIKLVSFLAGLPALVEIHASFRDVAPARFLKKLTRLAVNDDNAVSLANELVLTSAAIRKVSMETQRTPTVTLVQLLTNLPELEIVHWVGCAPPRLADLLTTPALELRLETLHTLILCETILAPAWFEWFYTCSNLTTLELIRIEVVDVQLRVPNFAANRFYAQLSTLRLVECKANTLLWQHLQHSHFASLRRLVFVGCAMAEEDCLRWLEFCHSLESLEMQTCYIASWTALARALSCRGDTWRDVRLLQLMDVQAGEVAERGGRSGPVPSAIAWEAILSLPSLTIGLPAARLPWTGSMEAQYLQRLGKWTQCLTHLVLWLPDLRPGIAMLQSRLQKGDFPRLSKLSLVLLEDREDWTDGRGLLAQLVQLRQVEEVCVQLVWDEVSARRALSGEIDAIVRTFSFQRSRVKST